MSVAAHREAAAGGLWSRMSLGQKQVIWAWGFLAVPLLFYVVIRFWPTFQAFYLSVTDWTITKPASFVGLENYQGSSQTRCSGRCSATPSST
jgi:multiple sugar transport system permease protein